MNSGPMRMPLLLAALALVPAVAAAKPKKDEPKAIDGAGQQTAQSQPAAQVNKVG